MDITITIIMPTKALQKLGRLPAPGPKIKKDPKSKSKPKLRITASSRITRQTSLSRTNLPPPPEAPPRIQEKKGRARTASSPLTSPAPSCSDSPRSDDIVESRVAGSEVAELIARCEREQTEIDRLLIEIESQCSDDPETWPESPSTATPDYLYTVLLAKPIELDAYYYYASSSPSASNPISTEDINDQMHNATAIPASPMSASLVTFDQDQIPQSQAIMGRDAQKYRQAIACWFPTGTSWAEPELELRAGYWVEGR
ncbi:hypothetical protein HD553DRAFT_359867 [Filobasidium floriforme]|uniref:uncharacterized protein n=1 Tax=Filobasidium floriforme TaxID=5210 RepID=UPI001E8DB057|nr:uncharacterized protein HD553DRAFT_359867 [Filobasidium floriforme]KAH8081280.1 hypothetical protein HD553DRAFT_359867 [Filobasidium floriforme]